MHIRQIRNATAILGLSTHCILIDPMLSPAGAMPGFKIRGGGRRPNPLVEVPDGAEAWLEECSAVLITHEHPDHLDGPGLDFIRARSVPVFATRQDAKNLRRKGLVVHELGHGAFGARVEVVPGQHGRGLVGFFLGPVHGVYLEVPNEPRIYLSGDAILTKDLLATIVRLDPDIVVAPAGVANFGIGGDILFTLEELALMLAKTRAHFVFNHLEALDHCPMTRERLRAYLNDAGFGARISIPDDGERLDFTELGAQVGAHKTAEIGPDRQRAPGLQKWVTSALTGT